MGIDDFWLVVLSRDLRSSSERTASDDDGLYLGRFKAVFETGFCPYESLVYSVVVDDHLPINRRGVRITTLFNGDSRIVGQCRTTVTQST